MNPSTQTQGGVALILSRSPTVDTNLTAKPDPNTTYITLWFDPQADAMRHLIRKVNQS